MAGRRSIELDRWTGLWVLEQAAALTAPNILLVAPVALSFCPRLCDTTAPPEGCWEECSGGNSSHQGAPHLSLSTPSLPICARKVVTPAWAKQQGPAHPLASPQHVFLVQTDQLILGGPMPPGQMGSPAVPGRPPGSRSLLACLFPKDSPTCLWDKKVWGQGQTSNRLQRAFIEIFVLGTEVFSPS